MANITLADAVNDSSNFTKAIDFGSQNVTTTGTMTCDVLVGGLPYGCFSSSQTQTTTGGTTADAITLNTDDFKHHITHSTSSNNSRVYIDEAGAYLITFSAIAKAGTVNKLLNIWLAVDGSPVARTNTIQNLSTASIERIITVTFINTFTANQYFELMMWSDANNTTLTATAAQTNPTRPACPSIIVTVNKISK